MFLSHVYEHCCAGGKVLAANLTGKCFMLRINSLEEGTRGQLEGLPHMLPPLISGLTQQHVGVIAQVFTIHHEGKAVERVWQLMLFQERLVAQSG